MTVRVTSSAGALTYPAGVFTRPGLDREHAGLQGPLPVVVHGLGPGLHLLDGGDGHLELLQLGGRVVVGPADDSLSLSVSLSVLCGVVLLDTRCSYGC